jgi:hypothetical protein
LYTSLGGPQIRSGRCEIQKIYCLAGNRTTSVQPVAHRYIDKAIPVPEEILRPNEAKVFFHPSKKEGKKMMNGTKETSVKIKNEMDMEMKERTR